MPGQEEVTAVLCGVQSVDGRIQETNVPVRRVSCVIAKLYSIHFSENNIFVDICLLFKTVFIQ